LKTFIDQLQEYDATFFDKLVAVYKKEAVNEMFNIITTEEFMDKDSQDAMLDNRNKNWVLKMPKMMQEKSNFFAVGAAHLGSENGVIKLLRKQGYTVKAIQK
jgi:uncharacterized protein